MQSEPNLAYENTHARKHTHRSVQNCRDEVVSNALHFKRGRVFILLFGFNQNGALGIHTDYLKNKDDL